MMAQSHASPPEEPVHQARLVVRATLTVEGREVSLRLIVDSGASGPVLQMDLVRDRQIKVKKRKQVVVVHNAS